MFPKRILIICQKSIDAESEHKLVLQRAAGPLPELVQKQFIDRESFDISNTYLFTERRIPNESKRPKTPPKRTVSGTSRRIPGKGYNQKAPGPAGNPCFSPISNDPLQAQV